MTGAAFKRRELADNLFIVTHVVDERHSGMRADRFLRLQYPHFSRNKLQKLIDEGRIEMQTKRLKAATILYPQDEIRVYTYRHQKEPDVDFNYKVLYEDEFLMAIDKPPNLPVHPAGKFFFNTLLMRLREERKDWTGENKGFFLIHRIDRETSGVLLIAKLQWVAGELVKQFRTRKTDKRYYAVVEGHCAHAEFSVDSDLGSDPKSLIRLKMAAFPKGQGELDALTHFKVVRRGRENDLVDCELMTGRQHQIRVHLSSIGHPVVGDKLYGKNGDLTFEEYLDLKEKFSQTKGPKSRQALHSRYLKFFHPALKKFMEIESPLPEDMALLLE